MDLGFAVAEDDEWSDNRPVATPALIELNDTEIAQAEIDESDKADHSDAASSPVLAAVSTPELEAEPNFCSEPLITSVDVSALLLAGASDALPLAQAQVLYSSEDDIIAAEVPIPVASKPSMQPVEVWHPGPAPREVPAMFTPAMAMQMPQGTYHHQPQEHDPRQAVAREQMRRMGPANPIHENQWTRYFIIKSNSHKNLVLSIENNVWATQHHNERRFNEAFDTAPYVILLFSVNQSGRFQGYARMMSRVGICGKEDVFNGFGRMFDVKWLKLHDLDFQELQGAMFDNPWNEGKNIRISRDGTEVPNYMGTAICRIIDQQVYDLDPDEYGADDEEAFNVIPDKMADTVHVDHGTKRQMKPIQSTSVWHPPTQSTPSQDPRWYRPQPYPTQSLAHSPYPVQHVQDPRIREFIELQQAVPRENTFPFHQAITHQPSAQFGVPPRRPPMMYPERPQARTAQLERNPFSPRGYEEPAQFFYREERRRELMPSSGPPQIVDMSGMSYSEYRKWHQDSVSDSSSGRLNSKAKKRHKSKSRMHKRKRSRRR